MVFGESRPSVTSSKYSNMCSVAEMSARTEAQSQAEAERLALHGGKPEVRDGEIEMEEARRDAEPGGHAETFGAADLQLKARPKPRLYQPFSTDGNTRRCGHARHGTQPLNPEEMHLAPISVIGCHSSKPRG
jgi:hypothetical protein